RDRSGNGVDRELSRAGCDSVWLSRRGARANWLNAECQGEHGVVLDTSSGSDCGVAAREQERDRGVFGSYAKGHRRRCAGPENAVTAIASGNVVVAAREIIDGARGRPGLQIKNGLRLVCWERRIRQNCHSA